MNWRGRPLTSHQVIVQSIAATTTRTGLTVRAALDTGTYPTGIKISHARLSALPLGRHGWHGDWNYTLHPSAQAAPLLPPPPPAQPRPGPGWLRHPALTGLTSRQWDALTAALAAPSRQLRDATLARRRNYRPRQIAPGSGRRPKLTLPDRLAATLIHHRHGLPQKALAGLLGITPETLNRHIGDIRHLLHQAGHAIAPSPHQLTTLDDLRRYAAACGITIPAEIKTAS
jgi:Rhodopirellula transposase DDE domain